MHTLQEFFYFTKGTEYLIGVLFLISFIFFYRLVFQAPGDDTE